MKTTNSSAVPLLSRFTPWLQLRPRLLCCLCLLLGIASQTQGALTPADIPGPDGIVYPDFRQAGIPGGIPTGLIIRTSITNHSGFPNDNLDDAGALEAAAAAAAAAGGGVVTIPAGNFYLDRPAIITNDNVVLRGAGSGSTKFFFRYSAPTNAVKFYKPATNAVVRANTWIEIHADPTNLVILRIKYNNTTLSAVTNAPGSWGARFFLTMSGGTAINAAGAGTRTLTAIAEYTGGIVRSNNITVNLVSGTDPNPNRTPSMLGAITFAGAGNIGNKFLLTANGTRGATTLTVTNTHNIVTGDAIELVAPATDRWDDEVDNLCTGDLFRHYLYKVTSVSGNVLTLNQPLRIDYPTIDGSYVQKFVPLRNCGVENFSLEQTKNLWTSGVMFSKVWECWATGMNVKKAGRFPIYTLTAKWCEIRNCTFDDAWWKGDGGTAYVGWEKSYDCLMENVTTYKMRHAPLVQWSAAGNVIRNSFFYDSDAQWHSGWTHENLFENNIIECNIGNGSYGYGMWASPPEDVQHGPNGPRNVIYNNDVTSPKTGVWLGGQNREWLILHNRFATDSGQGVYAKDSSSDHIIEGNVFSMKNGINGIWLNTANCTGVEVVNNKFYGVANSSEIVGGAIGAAVSTGNTTADYITPVTWVNNGFENNLANWNNSGDGGMSAVNASAKRTGGYGLRVTDTNPSAGSSLYSQAFTVQPGKGYLCRFWAKSVTGSGLGVYLKFYNSGGTEILSVSTGVPSNGIWAKYYVEEVSPPGAATAKIWIRAYHADTVTMDLDDFEFGELPFEIANPSFENGTNFWNFSADNSMSTITSGAAKTGTYGLHIVDNSATLGSSAESVSFAVTPGKTYQCRFWGRITSGSGLAVYLDYETSGGSPISPPTYEEIPTNTTEWRQYIVRGVAPTNAATVKVWVHSYSGAIVTGDVDDLVLSEVEPRPVPALASIYAWQKNPWIPFALTNPGFESNFTGWDTTADGGMSSAVAAAAYAGTKGLRVIDGVTNAGSSVASVNFPAEAGKNYQVRYRAKNVSGSGIGMYIQFFNSGGTNIGQQVQGLGTSTSWAAYTLNAVAPANTVSVRVWIHSYNANIVTADFDEIEFGEYGILP
ncbi:MAG TPA: carbohydrate binding domain-containing protein [Verrucomicrobiae bacterium]